MSSMATSNWRCVRRCVPLNAICSKKCAAPLLDAASYLLPASIQTPSVTVSHSAGTLSVATLKPFFSVVTSVYSGKAPSTAADDFCLCITRRAWRSILLLRRRASGGGNRRRCRGDGVWWRQPAAQRWRQRPSGARSDRCRPQTCAGSAQSPFERATRSLCKSQL